MTLFKGLLLALYSRPFYRQTALHGHGIGLSFLTIPLLILVLLMMLTLRPALHELMEKETKPMLAKFPAITVKDGAISIDKPTPYTIAFGEKDPVYVVFDTTRGAMSLDEVMTWMDQNHVLALITQDKVIMIKDDKHETRIMSAKDMPSGTLTQTDLMHYCDTFTTWAIPAFFILVTPALWIYHFVVVLILSLLARGVGALMRTPLDYDAILRISCITIVPYFALSILETLTHLDFGWLPRLLQFLLIIFVLYDVKQQNDQKL